MVCKVCFKAWRRCCDRSDAQRAKNKKYEHRPPRHTPAKEESSTPQVYTNQKPLYESFRSFSEIEDLKLS